LAETLFFVDDTPSISALELRTKARRLHAEFGVDLIVVDYLQLMRGDFRSENRVQEIASISRALKALARELNVPVLAISQLSRGVESRTDKIPRLSDLRESGALEQDADVVMFIYRKDMHGITAPEEANLAQIIIAKHRNGPVGIVELFFQKELAKFHDAEVRRREIVI
jgi:replicative DNA helicase